MNITKNGGGGGGRKEDWNSYLHFLVGKIYLHFVDVYVLQHLPENKYIERLALPTKVNQHFLIFKSVLKTYMDISFSMGQWKCFSICQHFQY